MQKHIYTFLISIVSALIGVFIYTLIIPKEVTILEREIVYSRFVNAKENSDSPNLDFVQPSKKARPAVVYIIAKTNQSNNYNKNNFAISNGSGVIISNDGYIVTNSHVIGDANKIEVILDDNRLFEARVISRDMMSDIALIKIEAEDLIALSFGDSDLLEVGEWVLAIGNPFKLKSTITAGIVSAKARNINIFEEQGIESFIQTDAAVNPGNSGGALINRDAELIGINTAILSKNGNYEGFSFAIPSNLVKKVVYDMRTYGTVQRAWMGVTIRTVDALIAKENGLDKPHGVLIEMVNKNGAAYDAGLLSDDIVLSINNTFTNSNPQLTEKIAQYRPGDIIKVTYLRKGNIQEVQLTLKNQINTTDLIALRKDKILRNLGFELRNLDQKEQKEYGTDGIKVISIYTNSIIGKINMEVGYIIQSINGVRVSNVNQLIKILKDSEGLIELSGVYGNFPGIFPYSFEKG